MPALKEVLGTRDLPEYLKYLEDRIAFLETNPYTGWAEYQDTEYTSSSPFTVLLDTDTVIPNNAGTIRQDQKPKDVDTLYNPLTKTIPGRYGDGLIVHCDFKFTSSSAAGAYFEVWLDLGASVVDLYRRVTTMPKGNDTEHGFSISVGTFTYDTWEALGAQFKIRASVNTDIYDVRYVLTRTHRGR